MDVRFKRHKEHPFTSWLDLRPESGVFFVEHPSGDLVPLESLPVPPEVVSPRMFAAISNHSCLAAIRDEILRYHTTNIGGSLTVPFSQGRIKCGAPIAITYIEWRMTPYFEV